MLFVQSLRGLSHTKLEDTTARAPRALRRGARPSRDEDDRPRGGGRVALAPAELRPHSRTAVVAGLIAGCCLTWNVANVGAVADPLAATYGVSLAAVGLLTTALFVTHLAAQLPAGIWSDRYGPRAVALGACIAAMVGNLLLLQGDDYGLAVAGRLVVGLGSGAGFVAGFDLVRAGGGGTVLQGAFGGATMAGAGLALVVLPALTDATSWRATYLTALALALVAALPVYAAGGLRPVGRPARGVLRDARLLPVGVLQAATFGLAVIAGNWVVTLLERDGASPATAGALGGLVLLAGIVTRPLGGALARRAGPGRRQLVGGSLVAASAGALLLASNGPSGSPGSARSRSASRRAFPSRRSSTPPSGSARTRPARRSPWSTAAPS